MTHKEMAFAVGEYCGNNMDGCDGCKIKDLCHPIHGMFPTNEDACRQAYLRITEGTEAPEEPKSPEEPIVAIVDVVNHPSHYCREGGMESIDEMVLIFGKEAVKTFCLLNVWKYRYRASDKNGIEDLKKSDWYIRKYKELCEGDNHE